MKPLRTFLIASAFVATVSTLSSRAAMIISEVDSAGSGTSAYAADWFELTNNGSTAVDITGWKMDDNSNSFALSVSLRGLTSIAAGQSVVFLEGTAAGTTDATLAANFKAAWFGANVPAGFTIAAYGGTGVSLSSTGDAVNIFDSTGTVVTRVDFGNVTAGATFDNAAGLNNVTLTTASAVGVNGAFTSATSSEIGSPGAVPEPGSVALLGLAGTALLFRRRR